MNVLADRHHAGLYHSLQLLGARLGWRLYTPIGHDWWDEGYWNFGRTTYEHDPLAQQYLMGAWNGGLEPWTIDPEFPGERIYGVDLATAKLMRWDLVIASLQDNQHGFARFARERGARFVIQVGNTGQLVDWDLDPIVLNSSEMPIVGTGVRYHQEFDTDVYRFREPSGRAVRSFVHLLDRTACYPEWLAFREAVGPGIDVLRYGHPADGEDPSYVENVKPNSRIAELMAASAWGWHDKPQGDGFGHVIHGWAAIGRPLIGHASHYVDKMGEPFWQDGVTCIDLDRHSAQEAAEIVRTIEPERHAEMCRTIRATFDELVDFNAEALAIAALLGTREAGAA